MFISNLTPMLWHSLELSRRDNSNECSQHRITLQFKEILQKLLTACINICSSECTGRDSFAIERFDNAVMLSDVLSKDQSWASCLSMEYSRTPEDRNTYSAHTCLLKAYTYYPFYFLESIPFLGLVSQSGDFRTSVKCRNVSRNEARSVVKPEM